MNSPEAHTPFLPSSFHRDLRYHDVILSGSPEDLVCLSNIISTPFVAEAIQRLVIRGRTMVSYHQSSPLPRSPLADASSLDLVFRKLLPPSECFFRMVNLEEFIVYHQDLAEPFASCLSFPSLRSVIFIDTDLRSVAALPTLFNVKTLIYSNEPVRRQMDGDPSEEWIAEQDLDVEAFSRRIGQILTASSRVLEGMSFSAHPFFAKKGFLEILDEECGTNSSPRLASIDVPEMDVASASFLALLSRCPSLSRIACRRITVDEEEKKDVVVLEPFDSSIRSLQLHSKPPNPLPLTNLARLLVALNFAQLQKLSLQGFTASSEDIAIIVATFPLLAHLEFLTWNSSEAVSRVLSVLALSQTPRPRLTFSIVFFTFSSTPTQAELALLFASLKELVTLSFHSDPGTNDASPFPPYVRLLDADYSRESAEYEVEYWSLCEAFEEFCSIVQTILDRCPKLALVAWLVDPFLQLEWIVNRTEEDSSIGTASISTNSSVLPSAVGIAQREIGQLLLNETGESVQCSPMVNYLLSGTVDSLNFGPLTILPPSSTLPPRLRPSEDLMERVRVELTGLDETRSSSSSTLSAHINSWR